MFYSRITFLNGYVILETHFMCNSIWWPVNKHVLWCRTPVVVMCAFAPPYVGCVAMLRLRTPRGLYLYTSDCFLHIGFNLFKRKRRNKSIAFISAEESNVLC